MNSVRQLHKIEIATKKKDVCIIVICIIYLCR